MKVYELMSQLSQVDAGAEVYVLGNDESFFNSSLLDVNGTDTVLETIARTGSQSDLEVHILCAGVTRTYENSQNS